MTRLYEWNSCDDICPLSFGSSHHVSVSNIMGLRLNQNIDWPALFELSNCLRVTPNKQPNLDLTCIRLGTYQTLENQNPENIT